MKKVTTYTEIEEIAANSFDFKFSFEGNNGSNFSIAVAKDIGAWEYSIFQDSKLIFDSPSYNTKESAKESLYIKMDKHGFKSQKFNPIAGKININKKEKLDLTNNRLLEKEEVDIEEFISKVELYNVEFKKEIKKLGVKTINGGSRKLKGPKEFTKGFFGMTYEEYKDSLGNVRAEYLKIIDIPEITFEKIDITSYEEVVYLNLFKGNTHFLLNSFDWTSLIKKLQTYEGERLERVKNYIKRLKEKYGDKFELLKEASKDEDYFIKNKFSIKIQLSYGMIGELNIEIKDIKVIKK